LRLDWRYVAKNLYYNSADLAVLQADPNPELMYRPKPNSSTVNGPSDRLRRVTINSQGARGPARAASKPANVIRIVCLGGSNVFGAEIDDADTWPAQLESWLNRLGPRRCEVWNYGVNAYIGLQMATLGREVVARLQPDLVIVAPSNFTAIAFLDRAPVEPYFARRPEYWERLIPGAALSETGLLFRARTWLMERFALYRYLRLKLAEMRRGNNEPFWLQSKDVFDRESTRALGDFLFDLRRRRIAACVVLGPFFQLGARPSGIEGVNSFNGVTAPTLALDASALPEEYRQIHPPPQVMSWYGEQIARWLLAEGLINQKGKGRASSPPR